MTIAQLPQADTQDLAPTGPPPQLVTGEQARLLAEIQTLHQVLIQDAQRRQRQRTSITVAERRAFLAWIGGAALLGVMKLPFLSVWAVLTIGVAALGLVTYSACIGAVTIWTEWRQRRQDTLIHLGQAAALEQDLIRDLLPYSRAALLHVAASARAADGRVGAAVSLYLGANRAGGVLGALFLVFGIFSAGKYLQDNRVALPLLDTQITADHVVMVGALLLLVSLALLLGAASVASLISTADVLERVAALKKNLAEDQKAATEVSRT